MNSTDNVTETNVWEGLFLAFRHYGKPTLYGPNKTPVVADVLEAGLIYAILTLTICFLFILPGFRGIERVFVCLRVMGALLTLASIMVCNFGQEWEVAAISTKTQYRSGIREEILADISVRIGLRSVNITLKGTPVEQVNEIINYNERFHWSDSWQQGRLGFGPFAGRFNREYREAQLKGLPYPILWIAEYFTLDGEGIRWGRYYRHAGFYTHIFMWTAFPLWMLAMILFTTVIHIGALFCVLTGGSLLIANLIYMFDRNEVSLVIPFEDASLTFSWGWCFWLNLFSAILTLLVGIVIIILDQLGFDESLARFFGIDPLNSLEETYAGPDENMPLGIKVENRKYRDDNSGDDYEIPAVPSPGRRSRMFIKSEIIDGNPVDPKFWGKPPDKPIFKPTMHRRFSRQKKKVSHEPGKLTTDRMQAFQDLP